MVYELIVCTVFGKSSIPKLRELLPQEEAGPRNLVIELLPNPVQELGTKYSLDKSLFLFISNFKSHGTTKWASKPTKDT